MSSSLVISHHVFLNKQQRYALQVPEAEIEVIGVCSPVWINNEEHQSKIVEEIFVKYRFRHCPEPEKHTITFTNEGFIVKMSPNMPIHLLSPIDGGSESLILTHKNFISTNERQFPVIHYLNTEDEEILLQTIVKE